jgi:catecholate siderophore receptor
VTATATAPGATTATAIDPSSLKVQKTTSYEIGTKWSLFHDQLALTLDAFQTRTTNARTADPDNPTVLTYVGTACAASNWASAAM